MQPEKYNKISQEKKISEKKPSIKNLRSLLKSRSHFYHIVKLNRALWSFELAALVINCQWKQFQKLLWPEPSQIFADFALFVGFPI